MKLAGRAATVAPRHLHGGRDISGPAWRIRRQCRNRNGGSYRSWGRPQARSSAKTATRRNGLDVASAFRASHAVKGWRKANASVAW